MRATHVGSVDSVPQRISSSGDLPSLPSPASNPSTFRSVREVYAEGRSATTTPRDATVTSPQRDPGLGIPRSDAHPLSVLPVAQPSDGARPMAPAATAYHVSLDPLSLHASTTTSRDVVRSSDVAQPRGPPLDPRPVSAQIPTRLPEGERRTGGGPIHRGDDAYTWRRTAGVSVDEGGPVHPQRATAPPTSSGTTGPWSTACVDTVVQPFGPSPRQAPPPHSPSAWMGTASGVSPTRTLLAPLRTGGQRTDRNEDRTSPLSLVGASRMDVPPDQRRWYPATAWDPAVRISHQGPVGMDGTPVVDARLWQTPASAAPVTRSSSLATQDVRLPHLGGRVEDPTLGEHGRPTRVSLPWGGGARDAPAVRDNAVIFTPSSVTHRSLDGGTIRPADGVGRAGGPSPAASVVRESLRWSGDTGTEDGLAPPRVSAVVPPTIGAVQRSYAETGATPAPPPVRQAPPSAVQDSSGTAAAHPSLPSPVDHRLQLASPVGMGGGTERHSVMAPVTAPVDLGPTHHQGPEATPLHARAREDWITRVAPAAHPGTVGLQSPPYGAGRRVFST